MSLSRFLLPALSALLATLAAPALAHPHIFVDARAVVQFNAQGEMTGVTNIWTFDEAFSAWQTQGLDTDNDGVLTSAEMQELADENLEGLASYGFYTFAGEGAQDLTFAKGASPRFDYKDGRSTLTFQALLSKPHRVGQRLELAINDPEYYVAITFAGPEAVSLDGAPQGCAARLEPPREMPPELADQLYALGPDVVELPPELAQAMRGVQGAIVVSCPSAGAPEAETAVEAVTDLAQSKPVPFGGPPREPSLAAGQGGLLGWIAAQQKAFYAAMTDTLGRLKTDGSAFWVLGGLSFLYGIFHAAGPGHGKVVISSYVLASERQLRRGIALSFAAALMQALVAVVFIGVAAFALRMTSLAMSDAARWIALGSYALVMLLGLYLVARHLFFGHRHGHEAVHRDRWGDHDHDHDHAAAHAHDHDHLHGDDDHMHHAVPASAATGNWREQLGVALAVGLRPCSGALVVLVFALSQGLLLAGIGAVLLMGLGTAITVAVLASLAVFAKGLAQRAGGPGSRLATTIVWWLELMGAVLVFLFGLALFLAEF